MDYERIDKICARQDCDNKLKKQQKFYCSPSCRSKDQPIGENAKNWRGGRCVDRNGYIVVYVDSHKYVLEHRLIMERHIGRKLKKNETVHHKNGQRQDNRIENLELRVAAHGPGSTHSHCETCTCFEGIE